jgi:hypothetical protein
MMKHIYRLTAAMIIGPASLIAHADTVFSNFGPGQTFGTAAYVIGTIPGVNQLIASPFTPTETVTLTDAILAMRQQQGSSPGITPVTVYIESSVSGAPGTILDTLSQVGSLGTTSSLIDFTCSSCSLLSAGTQYFAVAYQSSAAETDAWNFSVGPTETIYDNGIGSPTGPWSQDLNLEPGAFEVNGTTGATPEPSSIALFGTGVLTLAGAARRKFLSR